MCTTGASDRARASATNAASSGPVPATTRCASAPESRARVRARRARVRVASVRSGARRVRATTRRRAIPRSCAQPVGRGRAIDGDEALGRRKFGIVHTGPVKPSARSSLSIAGASATAASTRRHDDAPPAAAPAVRHTRRRSRGCAARRAWGRRRGLGERRDLHRPAAVCEHDIGSHRSERPRSRHAVAFRARSDPSRPGRRQRRQRGIGASVEAGRTRADDVRVAEVVERGREIERHEFRTAALTPADEVQDAHRLHRAMPFADRDARG